MATLPSPVEVNLPGRILARSGLAAQIPGAALRLGEIAITTDDYRFWVGDESASPPWILTSKFTGDIDWTGINPTFNNINVSKINGLSIAALIAANGGGGGSGGGPINYTIIQSLAQAQPIYPEIMSPGNVFTFAVTGAGTIVINTGLSWQHRGLVTYTTDQFTLLQRTFTTTASKVYHLIWDAPADNPPAGGPGVLRTNYPNGLLSIVDRTAANPVETDPSYDSSYDRMLIARLSTDASNNINVTPLVNKQFLTSSLFELVQGGIGIYSGTNIPTYLSSPRIWFDCRPTIGDGSGRCQSYFSYNWARTPKISPATGFVNYATKSANSQVPTCQEGGMQIPGKIITRYNATISYSTDYNSLGIIDSNGNFCLTNINAACFLDISANG